MRRKNQLLPEDITRRILETGLVGVFGVTGDDGYPYTVPVNYVYADGKIYFHSATTGHKLDGIQRNNKVSFCVIDQDEIVPEKLTSYFRSVIAFGKAAIVIDETLKRHVMELIAHKYSPGSEEKAAAAIQNAVNKLNVVEITIDHVTGKEADELVNRRLS